MQNPEILYFKSYYINIQSYFLKQYGTQSKPVFHFQLEGCNWLTIKTRNVIYFIPSSQNLPLVHKQI